ncbi:MAG: hypothetical protein H6757_06040 [Candidatus Omnitrophica bacterium]|nr:hypothetical protein [Candidatus Omnitrophota bacterium]
MNENSKKLKRKLEDLSPLFRAPQEFAENAQPFDQGTQIDAPALSQPRERIYESAGEILCLVDAADRSAHHSERTHALASRISSQSGACSIVSFHDGKKTVTGLKKNISTYHIARTEFERHRKSFFSAADFPWPSFSKTVLLDLEYFYGKEWNQVIRFMDKGLFLVRPDFESISETYKLIKMVTTLNHEIECGIIFQGAPGDPRGTFIYEELSKMASQFLKIALFWLGHWPENLETVHQEGASLSLEHLFLKPINKNSMPEKNRLFEFLRLLETEEAMTA